MSFQAPGQLPRKEELFVGSVDSGPPPLPAAVNLPLAGPEIPAQCLVKGQHFYGDILWRQPHSRKPKGPETP